MSVGRFKVGVQKAASMVAKTTTRRPAVAKEVEPSHGMTRALQRRFEEHGLIPKDDYKPGAE